MTSKKITVFFLVAIFGLGIHLAAPTLTAAETPKQGGTLRIAMEAEPPSTDPHTTTATIVMVEGMHWLESPFVQGGKYEVIPDLAELAGIQVNQSRQANKLGQKDVDGLKPGKVCVHIAYEKLEHYPHHVKMAPDCFKDGEEGRGRWQEHFVMPVDCGTHTTYIVSWYKGMAWAKEGLPLPVMKRSESGPAAASAIAATGEDADAWEHAH